MSEIELSTNKLQIGTSSIAQVKKLHLKNLDCYVTNEVVCDLKFYGKLKKGKQIVNGYNLQHLIMP